MRKGLFLVLLLVSAVAFAQQYQEDRPPPASSPQEKLPVPAEIKFKADEFIISKIGREKFDSWIIYDAAGSRGSQEPVLGCSKENPACTVYTLSYKIEFPENYPLDFYYFLFFMDGHGHIVDYDRLPYCIENETHDECIYGIEKIAVPYCAADPKECVFPITAEKAKEIAAAAGLDKGKKEWDARFGFEYDNSTFAWFVRSVIESNEIGDARFNVMVIDANSGQVLETREERSVHAPLGGGSGIELLLLLLAFSIALFWVVWKIFWTLMKRFKKQ